MQLYQLLCSLDVCPSVCPSVWLSGRLSFNSHIARTVLSCSGCVSLFFAQLFYDFPWTRTTAANRQFPPHSGCPRPNRVSLAALGEELVQVLIGRLFLSPLLLSSLPCSSSLFLSFSAMFFLLISWSNYCNTAGNKRFNNFIMYFRKQQKKGRWSEDQQWYFTPNWNKTKQNKTKRIESKWNETKWGELKKMMK